MSPPKHRGPHPADARSFDAAQAPTLQRAVEELSWLLSRGYALNAALKLVGDRYQLLELDASDESALSRRGRLIRFLSKT